MPEAVVTPEQTRLAKVTRLDHGSHPDRSSGMCVMEAASWIAGEPWSDHPRCVCPVIGAFMRSWNDGLPDARRTELLLPLLPKALNTRGSDKLAERRSLMAADWLVRVNTPAWLRLAGLDAHADVLSTLPAITDMAQVPSIRGPIEAARKDADAAMDAAWAAAWDAAMDAAWAAAWDAAMDAARAAARAAAMDAAWAAARAAARAAAMDAARAAAMDAARAAANKKIESAVGDLQASAASLVERMCALRDEDA